MARKKLSPKTICELAYGLLEPNILVLYVSQKKKKEKKGTLSLNIKQGVIFSNQGTSKREGISENEAVSWTSQHLDPGLIPRAVTKEKYVPEPVFCKSRHVVYSIYTLLFWHIYLSWAKKQFSEELRKTCPWVAKKKEV